VTWEEWESVMMAYCQDRFQTFMGTKPKQVSRKFRIEVEQNCMGAMNLANAFAPLAGTFTKSVPGYVQYGQKNMLGFAPRTS
jgi:hypothetical protein